jgi:LPXTG-motif cell wall-anchored protein
MRFCRATLSWLLVVAALGLIGAAGALATSAGDQQYIDPLSGSTTTHHSTPAPSSSSSSGSSSSSTQGSTAGSTAASTPSAATSASTTATTATTATTGSQSSAATLPRTGFDAWLAAALGLVLFGTGVIVRRQQRRA